MEEISLRAARRSWHKAHAYTIEVEGKKLAEVQWWVPRSLNGPSAYVAIHEGQVIAVSQGRRSIIEDVFQYHHLPYSKDIEPPMKQS